MSPAKIKATAKNGPSVISCLSSGSVFRSYVVFTKKETQRRLCGRCVSSRMCGDGSNSRQFVIILRVASTLQFLDRLVECGDERLGCLRVAVDLRVVAGATVEGVRERSNEFCNGARVIRFRTGAAASFGDSVSFRHFHNLFRSGSVALTYATIHKSS